MSWLASLLPAPISPASAQLAPASNRKASSVSNVQEYTQDHGPKASHANIGAQTEIMEEEEDIRSPYLHVSEYLQL